MNQLKTFTANEIANTMVGQYRDPSETRYVTLADATAREAQLVDAAREVIRTELFFQDHPQKIAAQKALRAALPGMPTFKQVATVVEFRTEFSTFGVGTFHSEEEVPVGTKLYKLEGGAA